MPQSDARPFTCFGSPLDCELFIVGLNSATQLEKPFFERYWDDNYGFDRDLFESDYDKKRSKSGVRPRIEQFVEGAAPIRVLETNIYSVPTKKATDLRQEDKNPAIFEYIFRAIQPKAVFVHGREPVDYFITLTGTDSICGQSPIRTDVLGVNTAILAMPKALFTRGFEEIRNIGIQMKKLGSAA